MKNRDIGYGQLKILVVPIVLVAGAIACAMDFVYWRRKVSPGSKAVTGCDVPAPPVEAGQPPDPVKKKHVRRTTAQLLAAGIIPGSRGQRVTALAADPVLLEDLRMRAPVEPAKESSYALAKRKAEALCLVDPVFKAQYEKKEAERRVRKADLQRERYAANPEFKQKKLDALNGWKAVNGSEAEKNAALRVLQLNAASAAMTETQA